MNAVRVTGFDRWRGVMLAYPGAVLRGMSRDRTALFFSFLLPVAVMVVVGLAFGGSSRLDVGIVDGDESDLSRRIVANVGAPAELYVHRYATEAALGTALDRKEVQAGLVVPAGTSGRVDDGEHARLYVIVPGDDSQSLASYVAIRAALAPTQASITAGRAVAAGGGDAVAAIETARRIADGATTLVDVEDVGATGAVPFNRFALTASQNLVLFVFVTAMVGAALVVSARRHGVLRRSLSTRSSPTQVLAGLCLAILVVTVLQSLVILALGSLVFNVNWGDPVAAMALVLVTDLTAAAAGICVGALGLNPDRTASMAPLLAIALAVVGGCVLPLELFPDSLLTLAHAVPHFWAVQAWQRLLFDGASLSDIAPNLAVLGGLAVVLFGIAVVAFGREWRGLRA